jgi:transcriptional regulator with XRE-family HTH domain
MDHVGQEVRRLREGKGWSQAKLAAAAEMAVSGVSQIENGKRNLSTATLAKLAKALDVEVADFFPKEQAPLPLDYSAAGRHPDELMTQRPSEAERIWLIEGVVNILRTYYELYQRQYSKMVEGLTWHGTGYMAHGHYFNTLQPAMERDGLLMHASYVVDGPAAVSERERAACKKLRDFDVEMQHLVWDMREVDNKNNARVRKEVSRGITRAQEWLEDNSKEVTVHREEQRGKGLEIALAEKLQEQLDTQLRALGERQSDARSDEDLHEAAKDFHHWWLFTFDILHTVLRQNPEARGPQLEKVVNEAAQAVKEEVPKAAPRSLPDMAEVMQGWSVHQGIDV